MESVGQPLALHQLHDDEQRAVVLADVIGGGDRGRSEQRGGPRFGEKALPPVWVLVVVGRDELQRHRATEPRVSRAEHFAHAAAAEPGADLVVLDDGADGGHGSGTWALQLRASPTQWYRTPGTPP